MQKRKLAEKCYLATNIAVLIRPRCRVNQDNWMTINGEKNKVNKWAIREMVSNDYS